MFTVPRLFQFSFYLCLFLSTLSLAYAEQVQIPSTLLIYIAAGLFLLLAYRLDGRWAMSIKQSNQLAVLIFIVWPTWMALSLRGSQPNADELDIELVRLALPYGGPLLTVLLLAKLFRPKGPRDYWTIHLMGLVQVVLACVLAMTNKLDRDAPLFPLIVVAYLLSLVWTLRNFSFYSHLLPSRLTVRQRILPLSRGEAVGQKTTLGLVTSLLWFGMICIVGLAFFFLVPRTQNPLGAGLNASIKPAVTGFKPSVDLNGVGRLETSEELVFRATIYDRNLYQTQVPGLPRWRGVTCSIYDENGRWRNARTDLTGFQMFRIQEPDKDNYLVSISLDPRKVSVAGAVSTPDVPNRVFGEMPIFSLETLGMTNIQPRVSLDPYSPPSDFNMVFFYQSKTEGSVSVTIGEHRPQRNLLYQQLIPIRMIGRNEWEQRLGRTRIGQSAVFDGSDIEAMERYLARLRTIPVNLASSGIIAKAAQKALADAKLPPTATVKDKAKAMESYLLNEKNFGYSLERLRVNSQLDPNEDFLENVRAGTCERFASALTLMLRSQGIAARIVLGFRGADWNSLSKLYEVKEYHAHAWVEAVIDEELTEERVRIPVQDEYREVNKKVLTKVHWLTLDPTPQNEAGLRDASTWAANVSFARYLWEFFILDFSGDLQRQRFFARFKTSWMESLIQWVRGLNWIEITLLAVALLFSLILAVLSLRLLKKLLARLRARRAQLAALPSVPFYRRFILMLERKFNLWPKPQQTALEYSQQAEQILKRTAAAASAASLTQQLAQSYHAVRFGGEILDGKAKTLETELDKLQAILK